MDQAGPLTVIQSHKELEACFETEGGPLFFAPPVEYAADAAASVERFLLLRIQAVIKRLKFGFDCLQAGKPDLCHLFGKRHSARRRRKI
jgi:hypothetical protein